jgi:hypothetical protein
MNNNNERFICSKCDSEIIDNGIRGFDCDHLICHNCFINHLLETETMILFPEKIIKCIVIGCNKYKGIRGDWFIRFVNETNNQNLIKKYRNSFLLYEYNLRYIFNFDSYFNIIFSFFEWIGGLFSWVNKYELLTLVLEIIGGIFGFILMIIYLLIFPLYPQFVIKHNFYKKLIPEIKNRNNNKILFNLFIIHYFFFLSLPIL